MLRRLIKTLMLYVSVWQKCDTSAKVIFYHDIGRKWTPMGTPVNVFWRHMALLRKDDVVCFDDGFRGIWDAKDEIARRCIKPIVFLSVGLVGQDGYLNWDEIRTLQKDYGFEFQCHTWSHQTLVGPYNDEVAEPINGRTEEWYRHEIVDSKVELERQLGRKVTSLCFPVGYFSDDVIRRCKEAGYEKAYASYPGDLTDEYIQPRCITQDLSPLAFRATLNGGMMIFERRYKNLHKF